MKTDVLLLVGRAQSEGKPSTLLLAAFPPNPIPCLIWKPIVQKLSIFRWERKQKMQRRQMIHSKLLSELEPSCGTTTPAFCFWILWYFQAHGKLPVPCFAVCFWMDLVFDYLPWQAQQSLLRHRLHICWSPRGKLWFRLWGLRIADLVSSLPMKLLIWVPMVFLLHGHLPTQHD